MKKQLPRIASRLTLIGGAAAVAYALWWRKNPSACPYSQRFWLDLPHPFVTRSKLQQLLETTSNQRILEIGPGIGYYSLPVAHWLAPDSTLYLLDLQREMLDHTVTRAADHDISNIIPTQGDVQALPYSNDTFDIAYLVLTLGEVPDQQRALQELYRVLRPGGRLIVGETLPDPHWVRFEPLQERTEMIGFVFERKLGEERGYFASFQVPQ